MPDRKYTSIELTAEDIELRIIKQRSEQAKRYGLTLEQYMKAIINGETVVPSSQPTGSL
jgi:hypothetical protein